MNLLVLLQSQLLSKCSSEDFEVRSTLGLTVLRAR